MIFVASGLNSQNFKKIEIPSSLLITSGKFYTHEANKMKQGTNTNMKSKSKRLTLIIEKHSLDKTISPQWDNP